MPAKKPRPAFYSLSLTPLITILILIPIVFLVSGCAPRPQALPLDPEPRVAVVSAFDAEMSKLLGDTQGRREYVIHGRTYTTGGLAGSQVILVTSGISMVNAAMTVQTLLDHFNVSAVVFSGIAGGVNPDLHIGDVVVPSRWGQYQEQTFARQIGQEFDVPRLAEFGNYGMMVPQPVDTVREDGKPDESQSKFWFDVDQALLETAGVAAAQLSLESCPGLGDCLATQPRVVVGGNGVSGPTFVDNAGYREWVWQTFQADALDMESAAVAHVAFTNATPFIAFRSLSDLAGGGPGENEIATFFQLAADNSARVVTAFLAGLPEERE